MIMKRDVKFLNTREEQQTNKISKVSTIAKSSRRTLWKVDAIRHIICFCESYKIIVVSIVGQRVTKDEETRN